MHELEGLQALTFPTPTAKKQSTQSEIEVLLDEITPAGISKKEFQKVIEYATEGSHDFLYINRHAQRGEQIRKNLTEIIDITTLKKSNTKDY